MGAEGTSGSVSELPSYASPRLFEFPRWGARGLSERRATPGAGEEARRGARCQGGEHGARARGARLSPARSGPAPLSALPGARPSPASPRPRPAGSAEVSPPTLRRAALAAVEKPAPRRSSLRGAGQSAGTAPTRESARLRGPGAAAAAPAVGCGAELQPAPRVPGRPHLRGPRAARVGAGPKHLSASQRRRRPAHLFPAPRKVQAMICPRKRKSWKFLALELPPKKLADWLSDAEALSINSESWLRLETSVASGLS